MIIDFYATWCGPCKAIAPLFESLATEYHEIKFVKVDVGVDKTSASYFNVQSMPTFIAFVNSEMFQRNVGANPQSLKELVELLKASSELDNLIELQDGL